VRREGLSLKKMNRFILKKIILLLLPLLLVAFSPIHVMVCQGAMKQHCSPCCPKTMKGGEHFQSPVASETPSCCTIYQWQGVTFLNSTSLKDNNFYKDKSIPILSVQGSLPILHSALDSFRNSFSELSFTPPPLFVLKQSFLI